VQATLTHLDKFSVSDDHQKWHANAATRDTCDVLEIPNSGCEKPRQMCMYVAVLFQPDMSELLIPSTAAHM